MEGIKRKSSSPLAPTLAAKSVDELVDWLINKDFESEESREAMNEIIRRAALWTEAQEKIKNIKNQVVDNYNSFGSTNPAKVLAPDPSNKGH
jgi:hypothetical protein